MEDFSSTFFDLPSSSALCAVTTTTNVTSGSFSITTENCTNTENLLQEPVYDLDLMLMQASEDSNHIQQQDSLSAILDNLSDDSAAPAESGNLNFDSIIEPAKSSESFSTTSAGSANALLEHSMPCSVVSTAQKCVKNTNIVQVKLVKPLGVTDSAVPGIGTHNLIPVTVHSLTGQKHSYIRTSLPICGPRVHLVPVNNHAVISNSNKKENQRQSPKVNLTDPSHLKIKVSNVVASFRVRCHLNLRQIALESIDVVYEKETQKVVMKLREPKCTANMFSSGKILCTGSTSEENAKKAARKLCRRLLKLGFKIRLSNFKIVNVLAGSKMPYAINIQDFSRAFKGKNLSYEPEIHPGITFHDPATKATLKIFSTGSVTVAGRSVSRVTNAIKNVYPLFKEFYQFDKPNVNYIYDDTFLSDDETFS